MPLNSKAPQNNMTTTLNHTKPCMWEASHNIYNTDEDMWHYSLILAMEGELSWFVGLDVYYYWFDHKHFRSNGS